MPKMCWGALDALISVVISGNVSVSTNPHAKVGDTVTMSFLADPTPTVREIPGQGIIYDGIGPYAVCKDDFSLTVGGSMPTHLGPMPVAIDGTPSGLWFSLMKGRPVDDGAWVSTNPTDGAVGLPLLVHGAGNSGPKTRETYGAVIDLRLKRHTIPSLELEKAIGSYDAGDFVSGSMGIWRAWEANVEIEVEFEQLQISKAQRRLRD